MALVSEIIEELDDIIALDSWKIAAKSIISAKLKPIKDALVDGACAALLVVPSSAPVIQTLKEAIVMLSEDG